MSQLAAHSLGMEGFAIQRATADDVAAIVALLADDEFGAGREDVAAADLAPYGDAFAAVDADPRQLLLVVTADDGTVAATMQLTFIAGLSRRGALRAQIEAVRVGRHYRGRRLGEAMINWAIAEARRRDCALVQLTSDKQREDAHRFYLKLGFTASHEGFKLLLPLRFGPVTRSRGERGHATHLNGLHRRVVGRCRVPRSWWPASA